MATLDRTRSALLKALLTETLIAIWMMLPPSSRNNYQQLEQRRSTEMLHWSLLLLYSSAPLTFELRSTDGGRKSKFSFNFDNFDNFLCTTVLVWCTFSYSYYFLLIKRTLIIWLWCFQSKAVRSMHSKTSLPHTGSSFLFSIDKWKFARWLVLLGFSQSRRGNSPKACSKQWLIKMRINKMLCLSEIYRPRMVVDSW